MKIIDANVVLRYLLQDVEELFNKAVSVLESQDVYIPNEVLAEVVYVFEKVYKVERTDIRDAILELIEYENIKIDDEEVISVALELFANRKLDFVDTLLFAYHKIRGYEIITFDKKLNNAMKEV